MGIPGFAKYIQDSASSYFENYKLANCTLVIDGHSLSCQIYNWNQVPEPDARCFNCYGGDYDKYAHTLMGFFHMLQEANVKPIVVFDGGFEAKKLPTILKRMQDKIEIGIRMDSAMEVAQPWKVVFPLFLRETFKDVLKQLAIPMAMCQFEGDTEIASLGHSLNCPVLTFDSDYFLFGVKYIPFKSIRNNVVKVSGSSDSYKFIPCQLYRIEKLLQKFPGLELGTLHLLPVLVGNDYIKAGIFREFIRELSTDKSRSNIDLVLAWLANQTPEGAVLKILDSFETSQERQRILNAIEKIVTSYQLTGTKLFQYFDIKTNASNGWKQLDFASLKEKLVEGPSSPKRAKLDTSPNNNQGEIHADSEELKVAHLENNNNTSLVTGVFEQNFTKCLYPSSFMDILTQQTYYCIPQVESRELESPHKVSFNILRAIHKILAGGTNGLQSSKQFTIVARSFGSRVKHFKQTTYSVSLPSLEEVEKLSLKDRRAVLFRVLNIDSENCPAVLEKFPTEWHIFLISLQYAALNTTIEPSLMYPLVIMFMILNYIDHKIGYFRSPQAYRSTYKAEMQNYPKNTKHTPVRADRNCFHSLLKQDCTVFMKKVIHFFTRNPYEDSQHFDGKLVHKIAEIQSCMLHIKYLNGLLKMPYPDLIIHHIINCSFIYNLTKDVRKRALPEARYFQGLFEDCPSISASLEYAIRQINKLIMLKSS
ncbi:protein asteroid [Dendroctonus ponderosae]|uniref:protein asteroid n=1 Tax=Dendroctonus ponderosae TaxID=77166 RepID=UPI0020350FE3|nr:protein asteroid [Dendroctonus ponderosae]